jgi:translation elongation factor EF-4
MRTTKEARVGDTFHLSSHPVEPLPGFKPAKSMVCEKKYLMEISVKFFFYF